MIARAFHKSIPLYLVNGRLSHKSYQAYAISSWFLKDTLKKITYSFVQTSKHKERFLKLGIDENRIEAVGSVKFDISSTDVHPIEAAPFYFRSQHSPWRRRNIA